MKALRQMRRDRLTLGMMIGIPTLQLLQFGFAINPNVCDLPAAFTEMTDTAGSRALAQDRACVRPA
jgi:ABC-2 type transport system permease protein